MRNSAKLIMTAVVLSILIGTTGLWQALALPPSSETPTALSSYGTTVISGTFSPSGTRNVVDIYVFSTSGPFYVQKINVNDFSLAVLKTLNLLSVAYDGSNGLVEFVNNCPVVVPTSPTPSNGFGDIMSVVPGRMVDQTGAFAIPAAGELFFVLRYGGCTGPNFPSGIHLQWEATILAPTSAMVSTCANEGPTFLTSCTST